MKKKLSNFFTLLAPFALLVGCAAPPPAPPPISAISETPDLSPYTQFELYAQNSSSAEPPLHGKLRYIPVGAQFEVSRQDGGNLGRLHVQPDICRDDPSPECQRRFIISGRLQAYNMNLSCTLPVRNDINAGYRLQTLAGLCQSQHGRAYSIQIFAK